MSLLISSNILKLRVILQVGFVFYIFIRELVIMIVLILIENFRVF